MSSEMHGVAFEAFNKIPRLNRHVVITEKIDGTNAQVYIGADGTIIAGSRNRWLTPESDNFGFARWVHDNADKLRTLGEGRHFGEWWGAGIQRRYGLDHKRFSLFNVGRWTEEQAAAAGCFLVPVLYQGIDLHGGLAEALTTLRAAGSVASPGFHEPEGVVVYHSAGRNLYKVTLEGDEQPKGMAAP